MQAPATPKSLDSGADENANRPRPEGLTRQLRAVPDEPGVAERRRLVAELHPTNTQLEISLALKRLGFAASPTTVARDEKELRLARTRGRPRGSANGEKNVKNELADLQVREQAARDAGKVGLERRAAALYRSDPSVTLRDVGRTLRRSDTTAMRILDRADVPRWPAGRRRGVTYGLRPAAVGAAISAAKLRFHNSSAGARWRVGASQRMRRWWDRGEGAPVKAVEDRGYLPGRKWSANTARRWGGKWGARRSAENGNKPGPKSAAELQRDEIYRRWKAGVSPQKIAEGLGLSRTAVRRQIAKALELENLAETLPS